MTGAARQIPSFEARPFRRRATRHAIVIPVLDEGARLGRQLARMRPFSGGADVIVADGGSTDGSVEARLVEPLGVRAVLVKTGPGRLSAQMRMAMAWALDEGYEGLIFIDGNDKDDPAPIPTFVALLEQGFDHVQGSRYMPGGVERNTPFLRKWGVRLLHAPLVSIAAGMRCTDTTNGFRAYSRRLLEDPRVAPLRDVFDRYQLHYYLAIRAARLGFRCVETPVTRAYPEGRAPTKIRGLRGNLDVLGNLLAACTHRYDPE